MEFEDARLQSHFEDARLQNFQPLPSQLPLKPQKGKDTNHWFPDSGRKHIRWSWEGYLKSINFANECITRESIFFDSSGKKSSEARTPCFYSQMKVFHPPNAMFPSWSQRPHTFKNCATSLGARTCSPLIHNGSRQPCTLVTPPQKKVQSPFKNPVHWWIPLVPSPSVRIFPVPSRALFFRIKKSLVLLDRKTLHPVHAIFWFGVARLQNGFEDVRLQTASETILSIKVYDGVSEFQQAVFRISVPRSIHLTPSGTSKKSQKRTKKCK